jgi:hypothetical protein
VSFCGFDVGFSGREIIIVSPKRDNVASGLCSLSRGSNVDLLALLCSEAGNHAIKTNFVLLDKWIFYSCGIELEFCA